LEAIIEKILIKYMENLNSVKGSLDRSGILIVKFRRSFISVYLVLGNMIDFMSYAIVFWMFSQTSCKD